MKYTNELAILPLFDEVFILPVSPIPNYRVTVNVDKMSIGVELDTYYPSGRTSISLKYKDVYIVSRVGLKYYVNYSFLDKRIEGAIFISPIILPAKSDINFSDFGTNINLMYGIIRS